MKKPEKKYPTGEELRIFKIITRRE